ncbi:MAG: flagellar hook-length control protein FliK [Campylobacterales bacterium]
MLELLLKTKPAQEPSLKGLIGQGDELKKGEKSDFFSMLLSIKDAKESKGVSSLEAFKSLNLKGKEAQEVISKELVAKLGSSKDRVKFMLVGERDAKPKEMSLKELFKLAKSKELNLEKIEIVHDKKINGESKEVKTSFDKNSIKEALENQIKDTKKEPKETITTPKKADPELAQKLSQKEEAETKTKNSLKTLLASADKESKAKLDQEKQTQKSETVQNTKIVDEKATEDKKSEPKAPLKPEVITPKKEIEKPKEEATQDKKVDIKDGAKTEAQKSENLKNESIKTQTPKSEYAQKVADEAKNSETKESAKSENLKPEASKDESNKKSAIKDDTPKENIRQNEQKQNQAELKKDSNQPQSNPKTEVKREDTQRAESPKPIQEDKKVEQNQKEPKKSYFENDIPKEDRYAREKNQERDSRRIATEERAKVVMPNEPKQAQTQKSDETFKTSKEPSFLEKLFATSREFDTQSDGRRERKDDSESSQKKSFAKEDSGEKSSNIGNRFDFLSKSLNAKETLKNLASNLQREAQNYKPPFKKITLELNPAKLGSVEVTMVTRGKNLHINIGSNIQAIALLSQNMVDFKNALNDIGFGEVSMNFSSGEDSQNSSRQGGEDGSEKRGNSNSLYTSSKNEEEVSESVEIVLPRYM